MTSGRAEWPILVARLRAITNRLSLVRSDRSGDIAIIQEDLDRVVSSMEALLTPEEAVR